MTNPFLRSAEEGIVRNRLLAKNQKLVNEVSQPFFYREVKKVEHPPIAAKIVKAIEAASNKAVLGDAFIAKQLADRNKLTKQGLLMNEERQDLSTNRDTPALTDTKMYPAIEDAPPYLWNNHDLVRTMPFEDQVDSILKYPIRASDFNKITNTSDLEPWLDAFQHDERVQKAMTLADKKTAVRHNLEDKNLYISRALITST